MAHLSVSDLRKSFLSTEGSAVRALDGVTFEVARGEMFGLVGESGCGKTTLARCILRLIEPGSGEISMEGKDWLHLKGAALRRERRWVQAVFQDPETSLNPVMSVGDIVEEPLVIHRIGSRKERHTRVVELLERVGLTSGDTGRRPDELSGGQRQRVAIARALAPGPRLLVADEPTSALDAPIQLQILRLLQGLRREFGLTVLLISHQLGQILAVCDRVAVMLGGRFVELAEASELQSNPLHRHTRQLLEATRFGGPVGRDEGEFEAEKDTAGIPDLSEVNPGHWLARSKP